MVQEVKYGGFTATPDDYMCPDGDIAAMANLVHENAALHPVLPPSVKMESMPAGYRLLMIHDTSAITNYIFQNETNMCLAWLEESSTSETPSEIMGNMDHVNHIEAVGNTLVALTDNGLYYFLWDASMNTTGGYKYLGQHLPEIDLSFSLKHETAIGLSEQLLGSSDWSDYITNNTELTDEKKTQYNNILLGIINKTMAEEVTGKGRFGQPFFVRYALRLYDGSLTMHSSPVLMLPYSMSIGLYSTNGGHNVQASISKDALECRALVPESGWGLLNNWKDLITSVDIFISAPVYVYDQSGEVDHIKGDYYWTQGIEWDSTAHQYKAIRYGASTGTGWAFGCTYPQIDFERWKQNVMDCQNFYLLKSINPDGLSEYAVETVYDNDTPSNSTYRKTIDVADDYLQSLTSREVMTDDYQSHDILVAQSGYNFNGRMNIANIIRKVYRGYNPFSAFCYTDDGSSAQVFIYVDVVREGEKVTVMRKSMTEYNGANLSLQFSKEGMVWFFYPDPNAKRAVIKLNGTCYELWMQPHIGLNGAYWFHMDGLPASTTTITEPAATENPTISLPNKIYTSQVNNPFYFPLLGINTVGTGEIFGICAAVKAMSQGQFGQYPLYAFTSEGVWALQTTSEGGYSAVQPVTRDVCTDPGSITQMDDAVLFVTDRGIMIISGSQSQCISEIIDGREAFTLAALDAQRLSALASLVGAPVPALTMVPFKTFMKGARMIYDYVHQRIIVYNDTVSSGALVHQYAYIYSLESHKWGVMQSNLVDHINSYPEALAVTYDGKLVNLCEEITTAPVRVALVTRPLKLGGSDILKTVSTIIHRGDFGKGTDNGGTAARMQLCTILYASRDMEHWHLVGHSADKYLRGFLGSGFKYFRIMAVGDITARESITGATVQLEPRQTNKLR